jgi:hypothetical protein
VRLESDPQAGGSVPDSPVLLTSSLRRDDRLPQQLGRVPAACHGSAAHIHVVAVYQI